MTPAGQFERLRARLAESDPVVVRAIDEVDLGLLHWSLLLSPWQRLRAASVALNTLMRASDHRERLDRSIVNTWIGPS